jgi:small subunit ribosomal protein S4
LARYTDSVCRQCRRENLKLFLKGDRCYSDKCAFDRRAYPPGQHGERRGRKPSDYGVQLREKQKVKRMYGLSEKQFHLFFNKAERQKGITGFCELACSSSSVCSPSALTGQWQTSRYTIFCS